MKGEKGKTNIWVPTSHHTSGEPTHKLDKVVRDHAWDEDAYYIGEEQDELREHLVEIVVQCLLGSDG
jgi:hypothetical protein